MSQTKRILTLAAALLMLLPVFSSCAGTDDPKPADTTPSAETTAAPEETAEPDDDFYADRKNTKDNLPEKMDFGGQDIRILVQTKNNPIRKTTWFGEADSTDNVLLETYERNERVMDRLNINIVMCDPDLPANEEGFGTDSILRTSIMSFSDDWDIANGGIDRTLQGWLLDIIDLDYVDYDAPYWSSSFRDAATCEGRLFYVTGSVSLSGISEIFVTYFNKGLWADLHTGDGIDLYQVVRDGEWTIEKMAEFCTGVYSDLDGDGLVSVDDRFGLIMDYDTDQAFSLSGGANLTYTSYDEENGTYIWSLENERTASFYDKCKKLLFQDNRTYIPENNHDWGSVAGNMSKLMKNESLFINDKISKTQYMREMPDPGFGILPPPKFDVNQDHYTSYLFLTESLGIPVTCTVSDIVGASLEALNADSYRYVIGEYYDTAVKIKLSRDEDTVEMLDLAVDGVTFDPIHALIDYVDWNAITIIPKTLVSEKQLGRAMSMIAKYAKGVNKSFQELPGLIAAID